MIKVTVVSQADMPDHLPRPHEHRPKETLPATRVHTWLFSTNEQAQTFRRRLAKKGIEARTADVRTAGDLCP
jgi:hypothetical protein